MGRGIYYSNTLTDDLACQYEPFLIPTRANPKPEEKPEKVTPVKPESKRKSLKCDRVDKTRMKPLC